jgi:large subunit ribosomal protein L4
MQTKAKTKTADRTVAVYDMHAKKIDTVELDKQLFDGKVNSALLHQAVVMYAANRRRGTADTKTRAEVRGGGKKPWRQKGTGRARFGSIRNPIWRGGGVAFGPHQRDYSYHISRRARRVAVVSALNAKLNDKALYILDELKLEAPKTKKLAAFFTKLKIEPNAALVTDKLDDTIKRASQNLKHVKLLSPEKVCSDDILRHHCMVITKTALNKLVRRLHG